MINSQRKSKVCYKFDKYSDQYNELGKQKKGREGELNTH